jgi:hypothetical protein
MSQSIRRWSPQQVHAMVLSVILLQYSLWTRNMYNRASETTIKMLTCSKHAFRTRAKSRASSLDSEYIFAVGPRKKIYSSVCTCTYLQKMKKNTSTPLPLIFCNLAVKFTETVHLIHFQLCTSNYNCLLRSIQDPHSPNSNTYIAK